MDIDKLYKGQQVRVIIWNEYRPEHWSEEMDEFQNMVVTISDTDGEYVYIEEDDGEWSWNQFDFESYHPIPRDNPNMLYRQHKHQKLMNALRAKASKKTYKF